MRQGENALNVIERVEERLAELAPTLAEGVEVVPTYDRSRSSSARSTRCSTRSARRC
jgi:Cu/Ag efflux pump CusA